MPGCLWLFGAPAPQPTKDFQLLKPLLDFQIFLQWLSLQMAPCNLWALASLYSTGLGAVILHKRKCIIMADEMKGKNRHICLRTFSLGAVMDDRPSVECVFVFCRGAKWPGTGANRKRACPQTNEQHYSNGVFVVSAVRCGLNAAVTDYVWCTVSVCPGRTGEIRCLAMF